MYQFDLFLFMKKSTVMLWAIFGALLMGCSDEEIANVETSSRNAIGFNVLSNAAETRATPTTNTNLKNMTDEELTIFRRRNIGFVFQQYNLVPMLNVWENIILPVKLDGKKIEKKYVDEIIDTLGIRTKLENLPSALSGGQQQRVAIARALAAKPAILLADEPTGNLDSKTSQDVLGLLKVTSKRFHQTIVMITHNEEIAQMADRILQIEDGKIVSDSGLV